MIQGRSEATDWPRPPRDPVARRHWSPSRCVFCYRASRAPDAPVLPVSPCHMLGVVIFSSFLFMATAHFKLNMCYRPAQATPECTGTFVAVLESCDNIARATRIVWFILEASAYLQWHWNIRSCRYKSRRVSPKTSVHCECRFFFLAQVRRIKSDLYRPEFCVFHSQNYVTVCVCGA